MNTRVWLGVFGLLALVAGGYWVVRPVARWAELPDAQRATGSVVVKVLRGDRTPFAGAKVSVGPAETSLLSDADEDNYYGPVETDAEGRARIFIFANGKYDLQVEHEQLGLVSRVDSLEMRDPPQEVEIVFERLTGISGEVSRPDGQVLKKALYVSELATIVGELEFEGEIPASHSLSLTHHGELPRGSGTKFRIEFIEPGQERLVIDAPGYSTWSSELELNGGETKHLWVKMRRALALSGIVVDEHGKPFAGADVRPAGESSGMRTGPDGRFELLGLAAQPTSVIADAPGQVAILAGPFTPGSGQSKIELRLVPGVEVSGHLSSTGPALGEPVMLALIREPRVVDTERRTQLAADGTFSLAGVAPGNYELQISGFLKDSSVFREKLALTVPAGGARGLELSISP